MADQGAEQAAQRVPQPARFGPDPVALLPVLLFLLGALPLAASSVLLAPVLLLPLLSAVWVARARVVAIPIGLEVCNGLRAHRVAWSDVEGFDVPRRGPVRLLRQGARPVPMTALARRELPRLLAFANAAAA